MNIAVALGRRLVRLASGDVLGRAWTGGRFVRFWPLFFTTNVHCYCSLYRTGRFIHSVKTCFLFCRVCVVWLMADGLVTTAVATCIPAAACRTIAAGFYPLPALFLIFVPVRHDIAGAFHWTAYLCHFVS